MQRHFLLIESDTTTWTRLAACNCQGEQEIDSERQRAGQRARANFKSTKVSHEATESQAPVFSNPGSRILESRLDGSPIAYHVCPQLVRLRHNRQLSRPSRISTCSMTSVDRPCVGIWSTRLRRLVTAPSTNGSPRALSETTLSLLCGFPQGNVLYYLDAIQRLRPVCLVHQAVV